MGSEVAPGRFDVDGRVIIVTGGAGLLGREYCRALAAGGARVVAVDVDERELTALGEELDGAVHPVSADVSDETAVADVVRTTLARFGRIDGLVNNAAIDPKLDRGLDDRVSSTFEEYPLALWNRSLAVNVTGMFLCARAVAPAMRSQHRGVVVNVSSTYGLVGPDQRIYESDEPDAPRRIKPVAYSVTKSAVLGLTRYLAAYWAGTGIRVNTLTPGGVRNAQPDEFVRRYASRTPLGRMACRDEYSGALLFLLSDASSYMTGANLVVDGGWTAW